MTGSKSSDNQKKNEADLQKKKDELAKKHYGKKYDDLCSIRKGIIDSLIEQ